MAVRDNRKDVVPIHIVYLTSTSAGGGGGGGGNRSSEPVRRAEGRGTDRGTIRIAKPIEPRSSAIARANDAPPLPSLVLDAKPLASGFNDVLGLPLGGVSTGSSLGTGSGGGVGTGFGTGIGSGTGPGIGEGRGGGTGGGVYRVGGGVTAPQLVREVRPAYTASALERRVQGSVVLEMIVTATGSPSQIRVVRSLDADLDACAIAAAAQWEFKPGLLHGTPVAVRVSVVLDFTIH